jgi:simple sugar transport system ATP-binding protein
VDGEVYRGTRAETRRHKLFCLPEEPLRNACVGQMSVAENMALRSFDRPPYVRGGWWTVPGALRETARQLVERYRVRTPGVDAPVRALSGGNVQRVVLARELSGDVRVLVVANPVFGLDFKAVADIHAQILAVRDAGAAVLLVSEDLDEILELADRIVVMSGGRFVYETPVGAADTATIGRYMAGH